MSLENRKSDSTTRFFKLSTAVLFGVFVIYLFYLQVYRNQDYLAQSQRYTVQSVRIPAPRGEIYDRNYTVPLATNEEAFSIEVVPAEIGDSERNRVFDALARMLKISVEDINKKIPPKYYHLYQPISISNSTDYETVAQIAEQKDDFPGVYWNAQPVRRYVNLESLSHVIGYVGEMSRDEYKLLYNKGYSANDLIGKAGIEKQYDTLLKGTDGEISKSVDVKGKDISADQNKVAPPIPGKSLVLTIDRSIQEIAQKALGKRMGSVVVLKPATGEILAMVSYPWYDSNLFSSSAANSEYAKLLADPNNPLLNRAIQSSYPPASTFKTVLTTGILEEKVLSETQKILCTGHLDYGGRQWNCWVHSGHGSLDLKNALAQSCDVYFWLAGRDYLGVENIVNYAGLYGYGKPTGVDLPGENSGFVPNPQWKQKTYNEKWTPGDTMNLSIGQGYMLATPLQVADMIAMIVNDGVIYKPHILKEIRDPDTGAVVQKVEPEELSKVSINKETFAKVREYLRGVITVGSAHVPVSTKAVQIAGKTGTAEVGLRDRWHSWFASYGPYDAPVEDQIVVVTMIEASNPWEWWAPYAANVIYQAIFAGQDAETAAKTVHVNLDSTQLRGRAE